MVLGPWSSDAPGAPGIQVSACQVLGKLSTRKRKKGLEWITFDDIMMSGKINGVIRLLPHKELVMGSSPYSVGQKSVLFPQTPKLPNSQHIKLSMMIQFPGAAGSSFQQVMMLMFRQKKTSPEGLVILDYYYDCHNNPLYIVSIWVIEL